MNLVRHPSMNPMPGMLFMRRIPAVTRECRSVDSRASFRVLWLVMSWKVRHRESSWRVIMCSINDRSEMSFVEETLQLACDGFMSKDFAT